MNGEGHAQRQPEATVIEVNSGVKHDRGAVSGDRKEPELKVELPRSEFVKFLRAEGKFAEAAKIEGAPYNPDFGTTVSHTATKVKNAMITVTLALAPGGVLWLLYQGVRLAIPAARKWPSLGIKYSPTEVQGASLRGNVRRIG